MSGGLAREKAMWNSAPEQVTPDTMMGALLASGKDPSSSLRNTKRSGKAAADLETD
jgi:Tfp pilus assembly protein FimT